MEEEVIPTGRLFSQIWKTSSLETFPHFWHLSPTFAYILVTFANFFLHLSTFGKYFLQLTTNAQSMVTV